ncbi:U6 small nuclear RNA (adenine-(43)-N(6))-methyltransferase [Chironomus tepperi]|uniref:U6 small nuclear RNA (adenine-(43)-N(6))-methyltransferase n=1 Tax=Chironomus tepperi TaxID=113505 RepID=UPI00391F7EB2
MHSRNIYKTPPNFDDLRKLFPEFAEKVHVDVNGKIKLDFKDPESIRILTKCCLKKDFNLDIEIPPDKLLPTLPLRINYILWIEDLLNHCEIKSEIVGIDIGTGACSIYCLLSVRMNKDWKMFALEIDKENVNYAKGNISRNQLDEKVVLIDQEGGDKIFEKLFAVDDSQKTFTICNPPFFTSEKEMTQGENRTGKRKRHHLSPMRESLETVFSDGGELGFVTKILNESLELTNKIDIYSTMFGCKKNFEKFLALLKSHKIDSYTTTELVQGKVYRWAIAWSFSRNLSNFEKQVNQKTEKSRNVLKHVIENANFTEIHDLILQILKDLKISIKCIKCEHNKLYQYELEAVDNTWSNQRRKRRAEKRNEKFDDPANTSSQNLKMGFEINEKDNFIQIQIFFVDGNMSRDSVNQILQYIKNKLNVILGT